MKWSVWKSVLAGTVIGFVEAAGSEEARRRIRRPIPVVRLEERHAPDPRATGAGLWFLDPFAPARPSAMERRERHPGVRLVALSPARLLRRWAWPSRC